MDVFRGAERLMQMDTTVWRRHANPWSGLSRMATALPLLTLSGWSRMWLGWYALVPLGLTALWIWANPRVFPEPAHFGHWMSRGVLGERIFLEHRAELPRHHLRAAHLLSWASLPGAILALWGVVAFWWEGAVFGTVLMALPKVWFVDRMAWILDDWMKQGREIPGVAADEVRNDHP